MARRVVKYTIKAVDGLNNTSYIHVNGEKVQCVLSNGTPASLTYAGLGPDVEAARIKLARARDVRAGLSFCRAQRKDYTYTEY